MLSQKKRMFLINDVHDVNINATASVSFNLSVIYMLSL